MAAAVVALALAACSGDDGDVEPVVDGIDEPTATPDEPTTPTEEPTEPADPDDQAFDPAVVPDDLGAVDVAGVQRIMDELDGAIADLAELVAADGGFEEDAELQLRRVYTERAAGETRGVWEEALLPTMPDDPGGPVTTVIEVVGSSDGCVVVEAERDYGPLGAGDELDGLTWTLALRPDAGDPDDQNPTVWRLDTEAAVTDVDVPCLTEETTDA